MDLCETHIIGRQTREWILAATVCSPFRRHHIHAAGFSDAAEPYSMLRLEPAHWHVLVSSEGEGRILVEGDWRPCGRNQAYISPPGVPMGFYPAGGERWKFTWIFCTPALGHDSLANQCRVCEADAGLFETIIHNLQNEFNGVRDEGVISAWAQLLGTSVRRLVRPRKRKARLQPLWQEVDGNLSYHWSMAALSSRAGMSHEHLRRISLQETGRTPMKQVAYLRLQRAGHLLQTSQLKISAVAEAVGYADPFAFSTAFKRWMGCAPSRFIR